MSKKNYDYTIFPNNSKEKFVESCKLIENNLPEFEKIDILIDVDGTTIQLYRKDAVEVVVFDDYDVGAVYIESDVDLSAFVTDYWEGKKKPVAGFPGTPVVTAVG